MLVPMVVFMNIFRFTLLVALIALIPKFSFAKEIFSFEGQIDFLKNEFNVVLKIDEKNSVAATAKRISETDYQFVVDVKHLKTPFFDLLSKIESSVKITDNKGPSGKMFSNTSLKGEIWSQFLLIDYKPVQELSGGFEVTHFCCFFEILTFDVLFLFFL